MELNNKPFKRERVFLHSDTLTHLHRNVRPEIYEEFPTLDMCDLKQLSRYPDLTKLQDAIAEEHKLNRENVLLTNGADGAIKTVFETYVNPGTLVTYTTPNYAMYDVYSTVFQAQVAKISPTEDLCDPYPMYKDYISSGVLFICNPTAPIESVIFPDELIVLLTEAKKMNVLIFIDEVYHGFGAPTMDSLVTIFDNLVVARSFSKAWGLASIRVGYLLGREDTIERLESKRNAYEVSGVSAQIAMWALKNKGFFKGQIADTISARTMVKEKIKKMGFKVYGEYSNSLIIDLGSKESAEAVYNKLYARGFVTKYPMANTGISVTIGSHKTMTRFLSAFEGGINDTRS